MLFRQRYKLSIPEPCHEDWNKMHPVDRGRFCDSCSKVVTDFSQMTEREIEAFFRNKSQNSCGKFRTDQLDRTYASQRNIVIPAHKRLVRYLMSVFLIGSAAKEMKGQSQDTVIVQSDSLRNDSSLLADVILEQDSIQKTGDTTDLVSVDSVKLEVDVTTQVFIEEGFVVGNVYPGIEVCTQVYGTFVQVEDLPFRLFLSDTLRKVTGKIRPGIAILDEKDDNNSKPSPKKTLPEQKSEAILPSFFSLRSRNSGESKKS